MPIREYVRSVREAFHRGPHSQSFVPAGPDPGPDPQASNGEDANADPQWALRGDLPSEKLFIPDACLNTLASTIFRPQDKMTGVVKALHGSLGSPGGYSMVQVALYAHVCLVQTSRKEMAHNPIYHGGGGITYLSSEYNIDTSEERVIKVAGDTLYEYRQEGIREGKEILLPFQLLIPSEADGFQLAPSLTTYIRYFLCICATEYNTGDWRDLYLDGIIVKPRDDALGSIISLSICDPFLMMSPYQPLNLAKQPRWVLAQETVQQVPCPLTPNRGKGAQINEAEGTAVVCLYTPAHDLFVQRPFPLVVKLSVIAPASYGPQNADWTSFRLETPTGVSTRHKAQTVIQMHLPSTRGGDGNSHERLALYSTGKIHWDTVDPAPKGSMQAHEGAWELKNGFGWGEPQLEPPTSRFAGRWASHSIIKGTLNLSQVTPPTFSSKTGDFQIYNNIALVFWPRGRYMPTSVTKVTRDLSHPIQDNAQVSDGDQLPPYSA